MMHLANRYQSKKDEDDKLQMRKNASRLTNLFGVYEQKIKPVTQRYRKMLIIKRMGLQ